jgi:TolB-like protein
MARLVLALVLLGSLHGFAAETAKTNIAITELDAEGIDESSVRVISDRLRTELFKTGMFTVVERGQMEEILKEQGFQQSGCTSDACVVEVGQILGVKQMLAGSVGRIGGLFTLNIRMIDVATSSISHTVNVDCRCPIEDVLTKSTTDIARQLAAVAAGEEPPPLLSATADETERGREAVRRDGQGGKVHRKWPKWVFGSLAVVSVGCGVVMDGMVQEHVDEMKRIEEEYTRKVIDNPDANLDPASYYYQFYKDDYEDRYRAAEDNAGLRNVCYALSGLCTIMFGVSFAF